MIKFYDTNALLKLQEKIFDEDYFYISSVSLQELEHIKISQTKDPETKYKARKIIHLLNENNRQNYDVIIFDYEIQSIIYQNDFLEEDSPDSKIIASAMYAQEKSDCEDILFVTYDLCCKILASLRLNVEYCEDKSNDYNGFAEKKFNNDEMSIFYMNNKDSECCSLLQNEYFFVKNDENEIVDSYKMDKGELQKLKYIDFKSNMFGEIKPKDEYQKAAMDSLFYNQITMLRGAQGTGKSYLSLGYLFSQLEKNQIDKIIIFCNTVATMGAAKLGFYPGDKDEKLLDSQIGNFLSSKLGDKYIVEQLIQQGKLILLPMADIRGYDTTGMKAGIYITEAQNLDIELMRLALQRVGEDSIVILDGDSDQQVDSSMYAGDRNGMRRVSEIFKGQDFYGEITLQNIYRSKIANLAQKM